MAPHLGMSVWKMAVKPLATADFRAYLISVIARLTHHVHRIELQGPPGTGKTTADFTMSIFIIIAELKGGLLIRAVQNVPLTGLAQTFQDSSRDFKGEDVLRRWAVLEAPRSTGQPAALHLATAPHLAARVIAAQVTPKHNTGMKSTEAKRDFFSWHMRRYGCPRALSFMVGRQH